MQQLTYILILGVVSEPDMELAARYASQGMNIILAVKPGADVHAMAASLEQQYDVDIFVFEVDQAHGELPGAISSAAMEQFRWRY
ncbi:MAG TPA: hypothetical protein VM802_09000 [Chitinophaga sp.]|uniref:hypothetical protein n=1 Tax=Chitinophaga sp. TaxID=1869181 RepID=UPI002BD949A5|nr:hypothetical protein [Chitinophaga sp.]HVI44996.1 hypothetical protein [Chitinophaga sp.]